MAEAILFPLAGNILSTLAPRLLNHISLPWYAKEELRKLEKKISTIRNVLLHAQELQKSNDAVKEWLERLKDVLYEALDLIDEVATETLRQENVNDKSISRKVRYFFKSSNPILFRYGLGRKIKHITTSLDEISAEMRDFGFLVRTLDIPITKRNEGTTSFVDTQKIVGRDDDKQRLLQFVLSSFNDDNVHVIPIVGMGGLGKTTLAQMIFNDNSVKNEFDMKVWVCVSDDFNVKRILTEILSAMGENVMNNVMEQLKIGFRTKLSGKKFFIVLDDVWNDDPVEWKKLEELLMTGARGSRVVVTTRDKKVAKIVCTMEPYVLEGLSDGECLSIFLKWAFLKGEETKHTYLIDIGREIVKKCGGVPLAARTLGVLLYSKTSQKDWLLVRDSEMWAQVQNENSIISILKLSYDQMPSSLKKCFGYCSLFQKDELIEKEKLIYHWIAHGFIQSSDNNVELEDICEIYLEELLRRSFLEYARFDNQTRDFNRYTMHDLVHDLAKYVVGEEILILEKSNISAVSCRVRHLSSYNFSKVPETLIEGQKLRTIMSVVKRGLFVPAKKKRGLSTNPDIETTIGEAISHSQSLRVIDYGKYYERFASPIDIEQLIYLRYLRYPFTKTTSKSLCKLLNLQFLDLTGSQIDEFPQDFGNLRNLRVLILPFGITSLPEGVQSFCSLRKLIIKDSSKLGSLGSGLGCLSSLEHLEISNCSTLKFFDSDFQGLVSLKYLVLSHLPGLRELPIGLLDSAATLKHLKLGDCIYLYLTEEALPYLHSLELLQIAYCTNIVVLPNGMIRLRKLTHFHINSSSPLSERCIPEGRDWHKIAHVPYVFVGDRDARSIDHVPNPVLNPFFSQWE